MNHRVAILVLMSWAPLVQSAQQIPRGTIEGIVVNSVSGQVIAGVRILPMSSTGGARAGSATLESDAEGKFKILGLDPGIYRLGLSRNGFVRQEYGQRVFPGEGVPLQVSASAPLKDIVVRMIPTASVSGRITNSGQRPLSGVQIQLMRASYDYNGKRLLRASAFAETDDRGEYRLSFVTPGRYYLSAGASAENLIAPEDQLRPRSEPKRVAPQFYPGASEIQDAAALDLQPGASLSGIDWILRDDSSTHTVRGYVVDGVTGQRPSIEITLQYTGLAAEMGLHPQDRTTVEGFQFSEVMSGVYVLAASVQDGRNGADGTRSAYQVIEVAGGDIDVVLTIPPAVAIKGRWRVEGARMTSGRPEVELTADLPVAVESHTLAAPLAADGTFRLQGITPATYRVSAPGLPAGYYAKEIRYNDADVLGQPLRITPTDEPATLSVVIASEMGTVQGAVMNAERASVPGAQVALVPAQRARTDLFQGVAAGPDGSFQFSDVIPGEYKVFAWEALETNAYFDPEILSRAEESGSAVRVQGSSNPPITIRVIPLAK